MVTRVGDLEEVVEENGRKGEHSRIIGVGSEGVENFTRGEMPSPAVFPEVVVEELVGVGFAEKFGASAEGFDGIEFILDGAVKGFDVGVPGGAARGNAFVADAEVAQNALEGGRLEGFLAGGADEFGPVVRLDAQALEGDAVAAEVLEEISGKGGGVRGVVGGGEGDERGAGAHVASGELVAGQAFGGGSGPILGDVGEILDIDLDLFEGGQALFEGAEIPLAFPFGDAFGNQLGLAQDAVDGAWGAGEAALDLQAEGSPAIAGAKLADAGFKLGGQAAGTAAGSAGAIAQSGESPLLEAAQPLADGEAAGVEASGGFGEAVKAGVLDHLQAERKTVVFHKASCGKVAHRPSWRTRKRPNVLKPPPGGFFTGKSAGSPEEVRGEAAEAARLVPAERSLAVRTPRRGKSAGTAPASVSPGEG
jgi:hypothetical protein